MRKLGAGRGEGPAFKVIVLTCPACGTSFKVEQQALAPSGRRVRCSACGHCWHADVSDVPADKRLFLARRTTAAPQSPLPPRVDLPLRARPEEKATLLPPPSKNAPPSASRSRIFLGVFVLTLGAAMALAWTGREGLLARVPAAAPFISVVGGVFEQSENLLLEDVTLLRRRVEGERLLLVEGWVSNPGPHAVELPPLEARLLNREGALLHSWWFETEQEVLDAGARASFQTRTEDLPDAVAIEIEFGS